MRKSTHLTVTHSDDATAHAVGVRPAALSPSADGSSTLRRRFGGVSLRSRKALVALVALVAVFAAATTPAIVSDTGVASAAQSSVDGDSDVDLALFAFKLGASIQGATWS